MFAIQDPRFVTLVYLSDTGVRYTQLVSDLVYSGTLIDPETGEDMPIVEVQAEF